jgi:hypothetical protein
MFGMTPHFTIRVWAEVGEPPFFSIRRPVADIEVDPACETLTISRHRGLELIPQKMLTAGRNLATLYNLRALCNDTTETSVV